MPDDLAALAARHAALDAEVAAAARELAEARRTLAEARGLLPVLDNLRIAAPCSVDWSQMTGDQRVRTCADCNLQVFNLSAMTRDDAETLVRDRTGRLCVRYFQRADGTIMTADCKGGVRRRRRRRLAIAGATVAVAGAALALRHQPPRVAPPALDLAIGGEPVRGHAVVRASELPPPPPTARVVGPPPEHVGWTMGAVAVPDPTGDWKMGRR